MYCFMLYFEKKYLRSMCEHISKLAQKKKIHRMLVYHIYLFSNGDMNGKSVFFVFNAREEKEMMI